LPAGMLSPYPVISKAGSRTPGSSGATCRHSALDVGMPCTSATGVPAPLLEPPHRRTRDVSDALFHGSSCSRRRVLRGSP
jgi:hypothetical protein